MSNRQHLQVAITAGEPDETFVEIVTQDEQEFREQEEALGWTVYKFMQFPSEVEDEHLFPAGSVLAALLAFNADESGSLSECVERLLNRVFEAGRKFERELPTTSEDPACGM